MFVANAVNHCTTKFWLLHQCDCVVFSSSLNIDLVITRLVGTSKIPFFREVGAFHVIKVFSGMFIGFFFFSPAYSIYSILLVHLIVHTGRISLKHKFNIPDISS